MFVVPPSGGPVLFSCSLFPFVRLRQNSKNKVKSEKAPGRLKAVLRTECTASVVAERELEESQTAKDCS
jgi:hypothetical protein